MAFATNRRIARIPHLGSLIADDPRAIVGWGRKRSGRRAQRLARWLNRPCLLLEDGFVRSVGRHDPPMSLVLDDIGVFYDATAPSRMEATIAAGVDAAEAARARAVIAAWRAGAVSKYNHAPEYADPLPERYVLAIDQTFGDLSIDLGMADAASFQAMITAALIENPDCQVLLKVHPDVFTHRKRGWLAPDSEWPVPEWRDRVTVIGSDCHAVRLLRHARAVYAVTSLMGFEALMWGKPVRCFGMPFYAGWGLTVDELPPLARRQQVGIEALVHGVLVECSRYVDPASGRRWQVEDAIAHVAAGRRALLGDAVEQAFD